MTNFKRYLATVAIVGAAIVAIVAIVIRGIVSRKRESVMLYW
jgi:hypothetical protein